MGLFYFLRPNPGISNFACSNDSGKTWDRNPSINYGTETSTFLLVSSASLYICFRKCVIVIVNR